MEMTRLSGSVQYSEYAHQTKKEVNNLIEPGNEDLENITNENNQITPFEFFIIAWLSNLFDVPEEGDDSSG